MPVEDNGATAQKTAGSSATRATPSRRRLQLVSLVSWSVLVASLGFVGGWLVHEGWQVSRSPQTPNVIEIPSLNRDYEGAAPDLRGLSVQDAIQVLVDGGFDANMVEVVQSPWAGTADLGIAQNPVVGQKITDTVQLTASAEALVPDVIGQHYHDVVNQLRSLGVEPEVVDAFALTEPTGSVLAIEPEDGEVLPSTVRLTVAQPGSSMFFADLRAVDSICSSVDANLNGEAFPDSLRCRTGTIDRPQTGVWLLNRQAQALSGVVGVDDKGKSDASAEISVIGDGEILGTFSTSYAEPVEVNLDVTGVLRLEITTTSATRADVVLGTWLVKGTGDEIAALESSS